MAYSRIHGTSQFLEMSETSVLTKYNSVIKREGHGRVEHESSIPCPVAGGS